MGVAVATEGQFGITQLGWFDHLADDQWPMSEDSGHDQDTKCHEALPAPMEAPTRTVTFP